MFDLVCISLLFSLIGRVKTCESYDQSCQSGSDSWCCSYDEKCGSFSGECFDNGTILSPTVIAISIVVLLCSFISCLTCCIHKCQQQQQRRNYARSRQNVNVSVQPTIVSCSYPFIHEEPPPPYEEVVSNPPRF